MRDQQNPATSALAVIDNLPGVNVTEGDTFGFDDWSTTVNLRGYQTSLSHQQVGTTIDGFPNGDSNYGGGAKANRYIDSMNLGEVEVNQGIASIGTRTTESLGGTLNFTTDDPVEERRARIQISLGDFDSMRYYGRYDTGRILDGTMRAWISLNRNEASDWMEGSAQNEREHLAGKFIAEVDDYTLTGYFARDDIHEDNYQRLFSAAEFAADPRWDRLIGEWPGMPYVNQVYRRGWSQLRENNFGYLQLETGFIGEFRFAGGIYLHEMDGRGDWMPPYIADVTDDAGGPEYELLGNQPVLTPSNIGRIHFVDADLARLSPRPGCVSSITFPYGGAGPEFDPACYPTDAIPVQSYRHTHYARKRGGVTADFVWESELGGAPNTVSGGYWFEDSERHEWRDWHRIADASAGFDFNERAYWLQYNRNFPRATRMWYLQDQIEMGKFTLSLGARQFDVRNRREDLFDAFADIGLDSRSDVLLSGGVNYATPVAGLELFFGYSENIKPTLDLVLEREIRGEIAPETAENLEFGLRYIGSHVIASAVIFDNEFSNRLEFFDPRAAASGIPNYEIGQSGRYDNVGGIGSSGFELAANVELGANWSAYASYTGTQAEYIGSGLGPEADSALDIHPGNRVVGTPDSMWVLTLDWNRGPYSAGLSTKQVGSRFVDRGNSWATGQYRVSDLYMKLGGESMPYLPQRMELSVVVNNVFNESYLGGISGGIAGAGAWGAWLGAPRTAALIATMDF